VPSSAMAKQGRPTTFHSPEIPNTIVVHDTRLRPPRGMECCRTTPKSMEDYMRKSAQFGYGKTRSSCNISFPEVPITTAVHNTRLRPPRRMEYYRTIPKSIEDYTRKSAQFGYGKTRSSYNISFLRDTKYYCRPRH
jgi:hypothetical protein